MSAPSNIRNNYEEVLPGIYSLVPNEVYHQSEGLSKTDLTDIVDYSIATYQMRKNNPPRPTDPMIKGSAFHDLVLLPDEYKKNYLVGPTVSRSTKKWKEVAADNPDCIIITPGMSDDIHYMRDALYKNPTIRSILESDTILREVSIWQTDPSTSFIVKIRPDIITDGIIFDLKSTNSPHAKGFIHSVWKYSYHMQAAYYQYVATLNGMSISDFQFLVVGSKPPYLTAIYNLSDEVYNEGHDKFREALDIYNNYLHSDDKWDGLYYGRETVTL